MNEWILEKRMDEGIVERLNRLESAKDKMNDLINSWMNERMYKLMKKGWILNDQGWINKWMFKPER